MNKNRMYEVRWIEGLPVDPGFYLLSGIVHERYNHFEAGVLQVQQIANGIAYVLNGRFLYKRDIGTVYHAPANAIFNSAPITKENYNE